MAHNAFLVVLAILKVVFDLLIHLLGFAAVVAVVFIFAALLHKWGWL